MDPLLKLLKVRARESCENLGAMLGLTADEVRARMEEFERRGVIRGYRAVLNEEEANDGKVVAIIEVKVTPEREGGFNHIANRVCRFPEVSSAYLVSGQADLLLFIEGTDLRTVARFVSEKLSVIPGVTATATSFMLKTYKSHGFLMDTPDEHERLTVSP